MCEFVVRGGAVARRHVGVDVRQTRCVRSVPAAVGCLRLLYLSCGGPWELRALPAPGRQRALAKDSRVGVALCYALSAPRTLPRWHSKERFPALNAFHWRREPAQPAARCAGRRKCHVQGQDRAPAGRAPAGSLCQQLHGCAPGLPSVAHACAADAAAASVRYNCRPYSLQLPWKLFSSLPIAALRFCTGCATKLTEAAVQLIGSRASMHSMPSFIAANTCWPAYV